MKNNYSECIAIIPARYASTRFPGKPLAMLGDKCVLERVVRQVEKSGIRAVVATDDNRIYEAMDKIGIQTVMTSKNHRSGTDRIEEAAEILTTDASIIINVQGDEPFIRPQQIQALIECFEDEDTQIATLVKKVEKTAGINAIKDPNLVKVVFDDNGKALYFSRSAIPYLRGVSEDEWTERHQFYTHIGMYAYRRSTLAEITKLPQSSLEVAESLEQLRWLQFGYKIGVAVTSIDTIGIDTPEDLENAKEFLAKMT